MHLHEELYFEITAEGAKQQINKFISYITSGELDDFFEFSSDFILYSDNYLTSDDSANVSITISNDDFGIEIDEFDPEEFLDAMCAGGKDILIHGQLYDIDDEEFRFVSNIGDPCYLDASKMVFEDELDEVSKEENNY